jgi:hypothetical protein
MFRTMNPAHERVTVRHAHAGDERALARLAALDSGQAPAGPALVAETDARILAALPLGSGRPIADPFVPTAELVALLQLRADQLERPAGSGRVRRRIRSLLRARPATA